MVSQNTKYRLMVGVPAGAFLYYLSFTSYRAYLGLALVIPVSLELSTLHKSLMSGFPQKFSTSKRMIDLTSKFSFYISLIGILLFCLLDKKFYEAVYATTVLLTILLRTIFLYFFIQFEMKGKHDNDEQNIELAKTTYIMTALDSLSNLWIMYSIKCFLIMNTFIHGYQWMLVVFGFCFIPETTALAFGKKFGKTPFSFFISPKKTFEGLFGQYLGVFVTLSLVLAHVYYDSEGKLFSKLSFLEVFIMGLVLITFAIIGDLMESVLKRGIGLKDSSPTIAMMGKGLGGFMDKWDSIGVVSISLFIMVIFSPYGVVEN